jgi:acyl-coenzyme A thioesterase PaaI-like protein
MTEDTGVTVPAAAGSRADVAARRAAVAELGAVIRDLLDASVATEVGIDELRAVARALGPPRDRLAAVRRSITEPATVDDLAAGVRTFNPAFGPGNPIAPPLLVHTEQPGVVRATCTLGQAYEGPPTYAHGGITALLLDHALGHAARTSGTPGLTASLTVRFRAPVPLGVPLLIRAWVSGVEGRRSRPLATLGTQDDPDRVLVEGEAVFVGLTGDAAARMFAHARQDVDAWSLGTPPAPAAHDQPRHPS